MINRMYKYIQTCIDGILSPAHCVYCMCILSERDIFCKSCFDAIKPVPAVDIQLTTKYNMQVYAVTRYHEPIKSLILAKAYSNFIASMQLAQLLWRFSPIAHFEFDYIVPVPLHWTRKIKRGYNQAEIMADELGRLSGKPVLKLIKRSQRTVYQSQFSKVDREKNVHNVFCLAEPNNIYVRDKTVLMVDDLLTTGATLKNCAKLIVPLKPKKIIAAVGARA